MGKRMSRLSSRSVEYGPGGSDLRIRETTWEVPVPDDVPLSMCRHTEKLRLRGSCQAKASLDLPFDPLPNTIVTITGIDVSGAETNGSDPPSCPTSGVAAKVQRRGDQFVCSVQINDLGEDDEVTVAVNFAVYPCEDFPPAAAEQR